MAGTTAYADASAESARGDAINASNEQSRQTTSLYNEAKTAERNAQTSQDDSTLAQVAGKKKAELAALDQSTNTLLTGGGAGSPPPKQPKTLLGQ